MNMALLVVILIGSYQSEAQVIQHGSVVVLNLTNESLIVAADSRLITDGNKAPQDKHCKLLQFGHKVIFTSTGNIGMEERSEKLGLVSSWSNEDAAKQAFIYAQNRGQTDLKTIGTHWATIMHWQALYLTHSREVIQAAEEGSGAITTGFFAQAVGGKVESKLVIIRLDATKTPPVYATWSDLSGCLACGQPNNRKICAGGKRSVVTQVCSELESRKLPQRIEKGLAREEFLPIWLAKMTAACDLSQTVGGSIDALEITNSGKIRWLRKKPNCPETIDASNKTRRGKSVQKAPK